MESETVCEFCKHSRSNHRVVNSGACGDPECCGSEYEWCEDCGEACSGCDLAWRY